MGKETIIDEKKIEETIKSLPKGEFTVLDFIETFKELHPNEWNLLYELYGMYGEKRRYTSSTYLSNRLDLYSQKPGSLLFKFTRYREGRFKDRRRTTEKEAKVFGSPWIAVYRRKPKKELS